jgi:hypothetical protein
MLLEIQGLIRKRRLGNIDLHITLSLMARRLLIQVQDES